MKKKRITVVALLVSLLFISGQVYSQLDCKVLVPALSGKYDGGCKRGLAHGKGIAEGIDRYEGRFVKGYPHGKGRYDWSTGEYYQGDWKKGLRDGTGDYHFEYSGKDTVYSGIWEQDKYIGPNYGQPKVTQKLNIDRVNFNRLDDGNKVEMIVYQGGSPAQELYSFTVVGNSGVEYQLGKAVGFTGVLFPFKCRVTFDVLNAFRTQSFNCIVEYVINEPGNWQVKIITL
jgi:hypothetical protein